MNSIKTCLVSCFLLHIVTGGEECVKLDLWLEWGLELVVCLDLNLIQTEWNLRLVLGTESLGFLFFLIYSREIGFERSRTRVLENGIIYCLKICNLKV